MSGITVFPMGEGPALRFAVRELTERGIEIAENMSDFVTHVLLPVPTKDPDVTKIPENVTVIGGNLDFLPDTYDKLDLLREEQYLAENAALTADCALRLLGEHLPVAFRDCPILIIGWGRIGKCLARILKELGAKVYVAARKPSDLGMLTAFGYGAVEIGDIQPKNYRAIINTAPVPVLGESEHPTPCVKIDLASKKGMAGDDVVWARGLPGKMLPESSGKCIAQGILRHLGEGRK